MNTQEMERSGPPKIRLGLRPEKSAVKIVQVISRLCVGGTPVAVILATESLLRKGYPTHLLAGHVTGDEASMEDFALERGILPVRVRSLFRAISPYRDWISLWQLVRFFRRERPAIVHTHTAKAGVLGRVAARLAGVPICVHTFHGHVFNGHFSPMKSRVYLAIERILARWTDCLVAVSASQAIELAEKYRIASASKFVTIPVAFDLDRYIGLTGYSGFLRKQLACPVDAPLVGWVGRLTSVKNPARFLETAGLVLEKYPRARFAIIGDGELRKSVEEFSRNKNLTGAIHFLGWQKSLSEFYSDIDLLVMTSKHEGTPLALLEAMASGKPVISTNVGGIRDLMTGIAKPADGFEIFENGILTGASAVELASAVGYMLENPELGREMGGAGRAFVTEAFAIERSAAMLENLYLSLLEQIKRSEPDRSCVNRPIDEFGKTNIR